MNFILNSFEIKKVNMCCSTTCEYACMSILFLIVGLLIAVAQISLIYGTIIGILMLIPIDPFQHDITKGILLVVMCPILFALSCMIGCRYRSSVVSEDSTNNFSIHMGNNSMV